MIEESAASAECPAPYDAVIVGGALSGAATALQLLRRQPDLRVLIVEKNEAFGRRVGESTVEVSSYFLGRVLGLTGYLNEEHLCKQGLRFWFSNDACSGIGDCSEVGPGYNVRLAGYQIDRSRLDEKLLADAVNLGAELWRPARVKGIEFAASSSASAVETAGSPGGLHTIEVEAEGRLRQVRAHWLIDASGLMRLAGRQLDWLEENTEHPIASAWSRWSGVSCLDDREVLERHPSVAKRCRGTRYTATNHLMGDGWWSWWIPLKGGDVSIGVVFDERRVELPAGETMGARLRALLETHPMACELLRNATWNDGDVHFRRRLSYGPKRVFAPGVALVGDAAAFMDPFYSPGMDWISFTSYATASLVGRERAGEDVSAEVEEMNRRFVRSYRRWFEAIYQDKYDYMGDYELMRTAFLLDLGGYYFGVASQPWKHGADSFLTPPFSAPASSVPFFLIRLYNRRLAAMGRERRRRGVFGRSNHRRAYQFNSYAFNWTLPARLGLASLNWLRLELTEGWRTWFRQEEHAAPAPAAEAAGQRR